MHQNTAPREGPGALVQALAISDRAIGWLERSLAFIAALAMLVIMVMVAVDALGRYLFNNPFEASYTVVLMYLLPASMFFAFAITFRRGGHVAVEVFVALAPPRVFRLIMSLLLFAAAAIVLEMAYSGALIAYSSWAKNEAILGVYAWLVWPNKAIVPIGLGVLGARLVHAAIANLAASLTGAMDLAYPELAEADGADALKEPV